MNTQNLIASFPQQFIGQIIQPDQIESHEDKSARAIKIRGYHAGSPCFYFHTYSITEQRIDCDDSIYELITYYEHAIAWRLNDGKWLRQKLQAHHPVCSPGNQKEQGFEITEACEW